MDLDTTRTLEEVQQRIRALSSRDRQLWSIGLLVILVLASGFAALIAPNLMWAEHALTISTRYLPQLFFGFIALILLFNAYLLEQRRELNASRQDLMWELLFSQRLQNGSLLDPLTQIFNRRYLEYVLPREVALANRHNESLMFLIFDLDGFSRLNSRFGHAAGDQLLIETARLLAGSLGATETLLRYGGDEFLALLPECSTEQAQERVRQVLGQVKAWNEAAGKGYRMALSYGMAAYHAGLDVRDVLAEAEAKLQHYRKENVAERVRSFRPECLIVSRDPGATQVLQSVLDSLSVEVEVCTDTAVACEMLAPRRFEAIVVDTDLAEAQETLTRARTRYPARNLVVVALGTPAGSARFGANFVLEKPLSPSGVARTLRVIQALMYAERQRHFRHPISSPVSLRFNSHPECEGTATDLSEGGLAVRCTRSLQTGQTGSARFVLPETSTALDLRVQIAWTDGEGRAGLRFIEMPRSTRNALDRWLRERSTKLAAERPAHASSEPALRHGKKAAG